MTGQDTDDPFWSRGVEELNASLVSETQRLAATAQPILRSRSATGRNAMIKLPTLSRSAVIGL